MNNLRKFQTEADYTAATLNYPSVAWVVSGDSFHYDNAAPPVVNDKVMFSFKTFSAEDGEGKDIMFFNGYADGVDTGITSCTLNDVNILPDLNYGILENGSQKDTIYVSKIGVVGTDIDGWFAGELGGGWGSDTPSVDFLVPAQITNIDDVPSNTYKLVFEGTTPPILSVGTSDVTNLEGIYVPAEALSAYQSAWGGTFSSDIFHSISEYQGNLPV